MRLVHYLSAQFAGVEEIDIGRVAVYPYVDLVCAIVPAASYVATLGMQWPDSVLAERAYVALLYFEASLLIVLGDVRQELDKITVYRYHR